MPNVVDDRGLETGLWSEADPHGGTVSGEYLDGKRNGACVWFRATGGLLQRGGF